MTHAPYAPALVVLLSGMFALSAAQTGTTFDPTRPSSQWVTATAPLVATDAVPTEVDPAGVQILVIGATRRFAVIDGTLMHVGESRQGIKLLAIGAQSVRVRRDGTTVELRVTPDVRKKTYVPKPVPAKPVSTRKAINGDIQ